MRNVQCAGDVQATRSQLNGGGDQSPKSEKESTSAPTNGTLVPRKN